LTVQISKFLIECLDDLEERIDPAVEEKLRQEWIDFAWGRYSGQIFSPRRPKPTPSGFDWPKVSINSALENFELMALQQFSECSAVLANGSGDVLNVRCNYGTGILPSLFGLEIYVMDESMNTLPTVRPLHNLDSVQCLLDKGIPDLKQGYGGKVFEMGERFVEILSSYPKSTNVIQVYHPDLQGPLDICELLFGSSLFLALYDQPALVKDVLSLVCQTYIEYMKSWIKLHPFRTEGNAHWGLFYRGSIMLREDSGMNLSAEMFKEFSLPYDQRLLHEFGGGAVHFCGKGDHYIGNLAQLDDLTAINLTQPSYNDMETIYQNTIDRGICLLALDKETAHQAQRQNRDHQNRIHVR